jgi:hypothetical protein
MKTSRSGRHDGPWHIPSLQLTGHASFMSDIPESLRTALARRYDIGDVLGSGGMATVVNVTVIPPPITYLRSTELIVEEHQIPLIVNEVTCQPSDPVRVTAITADQEPAITTAGIHSFTATTICGQPTNFTWQFVPSSGGGWVIIFDGSNPQTYNVRAGDYTLTVTATPPSPGVALTRFVNVCTGGGMMLSVEDPGTDAVGGCGGGLP